MVAHRPICCPVSEQSNLIPTQNSGAGQRAEQAGNGILKPPGHHANSGKNQATEADDFSGIHGERLKRVDQGGCPGEIHHSLSMGDGTAGTREQECSQSRLHCVCGAEKAFFGEESSQASGRLNWLPGGSFYGFLSNKSEACNSQKC
jgi:hypothetical protein